MVFTAVTVMFARCRDESVMNNPPRYNPQIIVQMYPLEALISFRNLLMRFYGTKSNISEGVGRFLGRDAYIIDFLGREDRASFKALLLEFSNFILDILETTGVSYQFRYNSEDLLIGTLGEAPPRLQEAIWEFSIDYPFTHPLLSQHLANATDNEPIVDEVANAIDNEAIVDDDDEG